MYIPIHKLIYFENLSSLLQPIYLVKYQLSNSLINRSEKIHSLMHISDILLHCIMYSYKRIHRYHHIFSTLLYKALAYTSLETQRYLA